MSLTTTQAMAAFLEDISVTDYQKTSIIQARKTTVESNLKTAFPSTSDLPFSLGVLMGSAAKSTIVRPIDDIDVLAIFDNVNKAWDKYRYDSKAFIYRIRSAYDGLETAQVGTRGQAVRVFFQTGGHVDVAPVFSYGSDVYGLPDGSGGWINTAPTVATSWFTTRNAELGYNLAPLVRMLKKWNGAHSKRLRSFHLETMAGKAYKTGCDWGRDVHCTMVPRRHPGADVGFQIAHFSQPVAGCIPHWSWLIPDNPASPYQWNGKFSRPTFARVSGSVGRSADCQSFDSSPSASLMMSVPVSTP